MQAIPAIFSVLVAASGWFYLFYSRAIDRLAEFEDPRLNIRRLRLRRVGAGAMVLLAIAFSVGYYGVDQTRLTPAFAVAWLVVLVLLPVILLVGWADLRLTQRMRRERMHRYKNEDKSR